MSTATTNQSRLRPRIVVRLLTSLVLIGGAMTAAASPALAINHISGATPFSLVANNGYCVSTSGAMVVLNKCSGSDYQKWYGAYPYLGAGDTVMWQQKASGKCMTLDEGGVNQLLYIRTCTDQNQGADGSQNWFKWGNTSSSWANDKYYVNRSPDNNCFGVATVTAGRAVQMLPCSWTNTKVQWNKSWIQP